MARTKRSISTALLVQSIFPSSRSRIFVYEALE